MKKQIILVVFALFSLMMQGQSKRLADRYFWEFNYPKAIELYERMYEKGDDSQLVIGRIADAYYFNTKTEPAEKWYKILIDKYGDDGVPSEKLFRYAQVLKSNGKYELSDSVLIKLGKIDPSDRRSKKLQNDPEYLELLKTSESNVHIYIHNVSTNTEYSDFGGFGRNGSFYFASAKPVEGSKNKIYKWNEQPFLNVYKAKISEDKGDKILELFDQKLFELIKTNYHESNVVFTTDGRTMYFTRDNYDGRKTKKGKDKKIRLKLYKVTRDIETGKWGDIIELPFNSDEYSVGHPALSPDNKTLYFVSDMPGGLGATDLYEVSVYENNKYSEPVNLGSEINTEGREMFPFVSREGVLYFSSDGHLGLGGLDIFESTKDKDSKYSKVVNLKEPFNSNLDDFSFWIDDTAEKGFFSSNRKGGKGDDDIYSFIIDKYQPCYQIVNGVVKDSRTKALLSKATVKLIDSEGKVIKEVLSDDQGAYNFGEMPCNVEYVVLGSKQDYRDDRANVATTDVMGQEVTSELLLTPLIIDGKIVIRPIYFDFDKSYIRDDAKVELEDVVTVMNNNPNMVIKIESHTDSRGSRSYNRKLSDRRAKSTRDYIISRGISPKRIESAIGYGEYKLLNHCDDAHRNSCSEEEHQLNRRSYFIIVSGGPNVEVKNTAPTVIDRKPGK